MNSPSPVAQEGRVIVPAGTPTMGAVIGGLLALALQAAVPALPPVVTTPLISGASAWVAHWLHSKLGTPE